MSIISKESQQMCAQREKVNALTEEQIKQAAEIYKKAAQETRASADKDHVKVYYDMRGGASNG